MKSESSTKPARWMLVDDDDGLRAYMAELIAVIAEVQVESFSSGVAALNAFAAEPEAFEFIVSDLDMPGMSGIDFCKRIKAIRPDIRIFLATGSGLIGAHEATSFGFCGMISKPFALESLRNALAEAQTKGGGDKRRTRLSALRPKNHQPNQAGTVPVCMTA